MLREMTKRGIEKASRRGQNLMPLGPYAQSCFGPSISKIGSGSFRLLQPGPWGLLSENIGPHRKDPGTAGSKAWQQKGANIYMSRFRVLYPKKAKAQKSV